MLKVGRLSERDLEDCLMLLAHAREHGLPVDAARVAGALSALAPSSDAALTERRARLARALGLGGAGGGSQG